MELLKANLAVGETAEISLVWIDELGKVLRVKWHSEFELLSEARMKVFQLWCLHTSRVSFLKSIELLFEQAECHFFDLEFFHVLVFDLLLSGLNVGVPGRDLFTGHLLPGANIFLESERPSDGDDLLNQFLIPFVVVSTCSTLKFSHLLCNIELLLRVYRSYLESALLQSHGFLTGL